ncbi:MAG: hypothetical protein R3229_03590 [Alphaproteobacteria bacterium]|nr:hypothetical protein [Alphaproteobacteria bacterium]
MTDHSILKPELPDLPFQEEARLLTKIINFFGTVAPTALAQAIEARNLFEALDNLNDAQLAALGVERSEIGVLVLEKSGLIEG